MKTKAPSHPYWVLADVPPGLRVVVAVPVVEEAGLGIEELARKTQGLFDADGDLVAGTP